MKFIKGSTYPYTEINLRADNPTTGFPANALSSSDIRTAYEVSVVTEVTKPTQLGYKAVEQSPTLQGDGSYLQTWELVLKSADNLTADEIVDNKPARAADGSIEGFSGSNWFNYVEPKVAERQGDQWVMTYELKTMGYQEARLSEYGVPQSQMEYITENGLEAWQTKVAEIKAKYPKDGA